MGPRNVIEDNLSYLRTFDNKYSFLDIPRELSIKLQQSIAVVSSKLEKQGVRLALIGGFSTGKSTLINAILGEKLLTTRVNPTTVCPTYIQYNPSSQVVITLKAGMNTLTITTAAIKDVALSGKFIKGKEVKFEKVDCDLYRLSYTFSNAGEYKCCLLINGKFNRNFRFYVPDNNCELDFYYSSLVHEMSISYQYFHLPKSKLPTLIIEGVGYKKTVLMNDAFLNGYYSAVLPVPSGRYTATINFDWEWFIEKYPEYTILRKLGNLYSRILATVFPKFRFKTKKVNIGKLNMSIEFTNKQNRISEYAFYFNLHKQQLFLRNLNRTTFFKRVFTLQTDEDREQIANIISKYTAAKEDQQQGYSGLINEVRIEYPSEFLKEGLVIIDTPGIAAEHEHTAITLDVINNIADACLVLYPADQAGTITDLTFVNKYLQNISGEIFFAVTKADLAEDVDELNEILEVINERIISKTDIKKPKVFPLSPLKALTVPDSMEAKTFKETIGFIVRNMNENQEPIMIKHLLRIEQTIMNQIIDQTNEKKQEYFNSLHELQSYFIEDLDSFITKHKKDIYNDLEQKYNFDSYHELFFDPINNFVLTIKQDVKAKIYSAKNVRQLKRICELSIKMLMIGSNFKLSLVYNKCTNNFRSELFDLVKEAFESFEETFEKQYPLKRITNHRLDIKDEYLNNYISDISLDVAVTHASDAVSQGKTATGVGAGTGAVLGTIVFPGLGTLIGSVAGYYIGSLFGPPLHDVQEKAYTTISENIDEFFDTKIYPDIEKMILSKKQELNEVVMKIIREYLERYETIIGDLIVEHRDKEKQMETYIQSADHIIKELKVRTASLEKLFRNIQSESFTSSNNLNVFHH